LSYDRTGRSISKMREAMLVAGGIQSPARYEALFTAPGLPSFTCYPENITLPPRSFQTTPFTNWGPDYNIPTKREYGECAMSFILLQDWFERRYFESWMNKVIPTSAAQEPPQAGLGFVQSTLNTLIPGASTVYSGLSDRVALTENYSDYTTGYNNFGGIIQVNCLRTDGNGRGGNSSSRITASILMKDAYPLSITPTTLSAEASGYGTCVVVFTFREYVFY